MKEPERLSRSGDPLQRELLQAARRYEPPSRARARVLAVVSGAAASTAGVGKAAAAWATLKTMSVAKIGLAVMVLGVGGGVVHELGAPSRAIPTTLAPTPLVSARPVALAAPSEPAPSRAQPPLPEPGPEKARPPSDARGGSLERELADLEEVRALRRTQGPAATLRALATYRARYPHGQLTLEAEVIRIEALADAGDVAQADARAARFLTEHPSSLLAARVRRQRARWSAAP